MRARQRPVVSGREELVGAAGVAMESFDSDGHVYVHSERWNAVAEAPVREDQAVVQAIQRSIGSGANECFTFGHFEAAIVHFHSQRRRLVEGSA